MKQQNVVDISELGNEVCKTSGLHWNEALNLLKKNDVIPLERPREYYLSEMDEYEWDAPVKNAFLVIFANYGIDRFLLVDR